MSTTSSLTIAGVQKQLVKGKCVAVIAPPLSQAVFNEMVSILQDTSPLAQRSPRLEAAGLEFLHGKLLFNALGADAELKTSMEYLLNKALTNLQEKQSNADVIASARQKIENNLIQGAADAFGVAVVD